jgi:signal peptidase I
MTIGKSLKKFWNFLWNSDSFLSWLVFIVLAFILIKFVFFPIMSFALSTSLPLVIVESSSMHHDGSLFKSVTGFAVTNEDSFGTWWNKYSSWYTQEGINIDKTQDWNFQSGMDKGDIVVVRGVKPEKLKVGDVIVFEADQKHPVIHRIVNIEKKGNDYIFQTKGDNNNISGYEQFSFEKNISEGSVIGKAVLKVPKLGWLKLAFVELFNRI